MRNVFIKLGMGVVIISMGSQLSFAERTDIDLQGADHVRGKRIFVQHCAGCHGIEGKGDGYLLLGPDPANLTSPATKKKSDAALLQTIHEGRPNMPSWKARLSEEDSRTVLAYIRTLKK